MTAAVAAVAARVAALLAGIVGQEVDPALVTRALTHRSWAFEHDGAPHNERLEFLGDAVLGLVVTDHLYTHNPDVSEGQLAKVRAAVVNMRALASVARGIGLGEHLLLGKGEEMSGGRDKESILADTTEALIGATYVATGMAGAAALVHHLFDELMSTSACLGAGLDWKTSLQEAGSKFGLGVPSYRITEDGPDHHKEFTAEAVLGGRVYGTGVGSTKKIAEQVAAERAWLAVTNP